MEPISREQRAQMLAEYQRVRTIARRLNSELVKSLDRDAIDEAGRRLGILKKGILVFDTEDTATVLMDYALRHVRRDGQNAIERCLSRKSHPVEDRAVLEMMARVRYSIIQVEQVLPGFGMWVSDIFRDETSLLIDVNFSQTVQRHVVVATHIFGGAAFWMTTGAALPMTPDILRRVIRDLERRFGRRPEDYRSLSQDRESEIATLVVRTCLAKGMAEHVSYADPGSKPHFTGPGHATSSVSAPKSVQSGRNDPCPCGSGRKFKHCCGRGK